MKHNNTYKSCITLIFILSLFNNIFAQDLIVNSESKSGLELTLSINDFSINTIEHNGEQMHEFVFGALTPINDKGKPNLPSINRYIAIPQGANAKVKVNSFKKEVIEDINIVPSNGNFAATEKVVKDYRKDNDIYSKDEFYPANIVSLDKPTSLRGLDAVGLYICPVQFNPITKELIVYTEINISIEFDGGRGTFGDERLRSQYWDPIYQHNILNYNSLPKVDYEQRMQTWIKEDAEGAEYIILIPNDEGFRIQAQRLADYRKTHGIITKVYSLDEIGASNSDDIDEWFTYAYNNWDIAPVAACLLATHGQELWHNIPASYLSHPTEDSCISDNAYSDMNGDLLPDMVFSRLIAKSAEDAEALVNKQMEYEYLKPIMNPDYYKKPITCTGWDFQHWFQMCSESITGFFKKIGKEPQRINEIYNPFIDEDHTIEYPVDSIWSIGSNTNQIINFFGPNGLSYFPQYPIDAGDFDSGSEEQVIEAINNGSFYIHHRGHGGIENWAGPWVDVNTLTKSLNNKDKLTYVISSNCYTGIFGEYESFTGADISITEEFMLPSKDKTMGAVGVLAGTDVSFPFNNDIYFWGVMDYFDNSFMPMYGTDVEMNNNYVPAFANVSGKYFMSQLVFPNTYPESRETTYKLIHAHGDAFLRLFTEVPQPLTVTHDAFINYKSGSVQVNAPEGSTIAIYSQGDDDVELLAAAVGQGTNQTINIPNHTTPDRKMMVSVTKQNHLRYVGEIEIVVNEGQYVIFEDFNLYEDQQFLNFNQDTYIDFKLKNLGPDNANNGKLTLTCDSDKIHISDNNNTFNTIEGNTIFDLNDAFHIKIDDGIENNTTLIFILTIEHDDVVHTKKFYVEVKAPVFEIVSVETIAEGDDTFIEPDEYIKCKFTIRNIGVCASNSATANIISKDNYLEILTDDIIIESIGANEEITVEFDVYVKPEASSQFLSTIVCEIVSGSYSASKDNDIYLGVIIEDFESGSISDMWNTNNKWIICENTSSNCYGNYCIRTNYGYKCVLIAECYIPYDGYLTFGYSTNMKDKTRSMDLWVDDEHIKKIYANENWNRYSHFVEAGNHTFRWSANANSVKLYIDHIVLLKEAYDNVNETVEVSNSYNIYPNPANDFINIEISDNHNDNFNISIYNSLGIKVLETSNENTINIEDLPSGMYFINVTTENFSQTKKVIKN